MGFYFRRSASFGPFRVNMSRSGFGYSVGTRGFRTGISSRGRQYTRVSLPGTGIGYQTGKSGCALALAAGLALLAAAAARHAWGPT